VAAGRDGARCWLLAVELADFIADQHLVLLTA
jgi:hypothetical protein